MSLSASPVVARRPMPRENWSGPGSTNPHGLVAETPIVNTGVSLDVGVLDVL